jgi:anti-anti-sigma regulatory factor
VLKITADADARRLILEGSLSGAWIGALEESWHAATTHVAPRQIVVDLTNVTFVDARGRQLLGRIHGAGAILFATGMSVVLIEEIAASTCAEEEP